MLRRPHLKLQERQDAEAQQAKQSLRRPQLRTTGHPVEPSLDEVRHDLRYRLAEKIVRHRRLILFVFLVSCLISGIFATMVPIDYDISSYVPKEARSTLATNLAFDQFSDAVPNLDVMTPPMDVASVLELKKRFQALPYVHQVLWLDDQADPTKPLPFLPQDLVSAFYKDQHALLSLTIKTEEYQQAIDELRQIAGPGTAIRGNAVSLARANVAAGSEMRRIMYFAVPLAFLILLIASKSWIEPLLFMLTIFAGVVLNMGSNIILGKISFITASVGAVLQLAVSMDYAIFLLSRFSQYRDEGHPLEEALILAIRKSFSAITSSALTTIFGFLALIFMRFRIGPDMGVVLAKGVCFSLVAVIFLLPVLILYTVRILDKTTHRSLLPSFRRTSVVMTHLGPFVLIFAILMSVPTFLAQSKNHFEYGMGNYPLDSIEYKDNQKILETFGERMQTLLLLPTGEPAVEQKLVRKIEEKPYVTSVIGYASSVGNQVPPMMVPSEQLKMLRNAHWTRYIVILKVPPESQLTFRSAEELRALTQEYAPKGMWTGENFVLLDMKDTINADNIIVNGLAILAVWLVLLINFKSLSIPFILVYTIEFSIWMNLSVPYFQQVGLHYIGYLVISTIQLGATVDYAILFAQHYFDNRKVFMPRVAAERAVREVIPAILPPALILTAVGYSLALISTLDIVAQLGTVLGRGALFSLFNVLMLLPTLLRYLDPLIRKTSLGLNHLKGKAKLDPAVHGGD